MWEIMDESGTDVLELTYKTEDSGTVHVWEIY